MKTRPTNENPKLEDDIPRAKKTIRNVKLILSLAN